MSEFAPAVSEPAPALTERLRGELVEAVAVVQDLASDHQRIMAAAQGSNGDDEHDVEGASIAFERSFAEAALQRAGARAQAAREALDRVEDGSYGRCVRCGRPIAAERLAALPLAVTCIDCAR